MTKSKLFSGFSLEECVSLEKILKPVERTFVKGEVIYLEGEPIISAGIIIEGRVIGEKFYQDGKSHLVHSFNAGETLGLETICSSKGDCPVTFTASEKTQVLLFAYFKMMCSDLVPPMQQLILQDNMIRILADQNIKSMYKLEVLSKRSLRNRIFVFLKILEGKLGTSTFSIGMNREQFAQYLCVNRSALSHELAAMQRDGLITFNKDQFTVISDYEE